MKLNSSVAFFTLATLGLSAAQVVDLGYASYEGTVNPVTGNTRFIGIRYAAPPTGSRRWQVPTVPDTVAGVIPANTQPAACLPAGYGGSPTNPFRRRATSDAFSEDCLFLNVVTPQISAVGKSAKPVVVWIHGGGYHMGSSEPFDGEDLVREAQGGVVVVIIQYRLGVYGFLAGNEVKSGGVLNAGLLDQEFALRWVQKNIAKFGGDPDKVTIWGQSAGAGSVLQHVIAHDGKTSPPLFRAAISSSSFLPSQYSYNDIIPRTIYNEVVDQTSCNTASDTLSCLRAVDTTTLQAANANISSSAFYGTFTFVPVVDGTFIKQRPTEAFRKHKFNGQALLAITNQHEGFIFVDPSTTSIPNYLRQLFPKFGEQDIQRAAAHYEHLGTPFDQASAIISEAIFTCPTYFMLRSFGQNGFKGGFGIPPSYHGDDVQYYFPSYTTTETGIPPSNSPFFNNTAFLTAFSKSFLDFALSLDPNHKSNTSTITPHWDKWADDSAEMLFNRTADAEPDIYLTKTSEALLQRCSFWESVGALSGQ